MRLPRLSGSPRPDSSEKDSQSLSTSTGDIESAQPRLPKWSLGILNDTQTDEVPGSVLLLSRIAKRNEPLGLRQQPTRRSSSSLPQPPGTETPGLHRRVSSLAPPKKTTKDGAIVLEPQPEDSRNDPLTWAVWRRDAALLSLGFYCMLGGGMTPILAAGFSNVASTFDVSTAEVALTTGLYMLGLGIGSVIMSPTAILYGKRPVYLFTAILFIASCIWCALSPSFTSLLLARIFQGIAVSPIECLPSATIAEIYFLHERAYRLGIYTLLLLGGKNLVPLVSAVIIQSLDWQWVFYISAMVAGFCLVLLFFFAPETFWDRTPVPKVYKPKSTQGSMLSELFRMRTGRVNKSKEQVPCSNGRRPRAQHAAEVPDASAVDDEETRPQRPSRRPHKEHVHFGGNISDPDFAFTSPPTSPDSNPLETTIKAIPIRPRTSSPHSGQNLDLAPNTDTEIPSSHRPTKLPYTEYYRHAPARTYVASLQPFHGRLSRDKWLRVAIRPFILYCYPAVLWSSLIYALSIGWLIVLSESVSDIYRSRQSYNFSALQTGLVYISPFIGGVMGTAVAGKVSDLIVRFMARRNDGVYEPEFRLVMAIPVAISTTAGLMGFGWSAAERDAWIVPTVFFGIVSFGCSLGSTTAITFCVDSYRQYAGEALVTLNFSKNVLHGLVFSLFFTHWLEAAGSKKVFISIGGIQLACCFLTIPLYIYGKRARMWTVRRNLMEKF